MGLTVHYRLSYPAAVSSDGAMEVLEKLRQAALDLPFEEVGELRRFEGEECDPERWRGTEWLWPVIQGQQYLNLGKDGGSRFGAISVTVRPLEMVVFSAWPGEECESMELGLARYPAFVELDWRIRAELEYRTGRRYPCRVPTGALGKGWRWKAFCKTQYASNVSTGHFLRCHAVVCALLREAQYLGFRVEVHDEGGFWGKWDYDALAREVGVWNRMVASFARSIEAMLNNTGTGITVEAPITGNAAYYEAGGIAPEIARDLAKLARRF